MKLALLQMNTAWHDREANLGKAAHMAAEAAAKGADVAILPEMFTSGFSMDTSRAAGPVGGPVRGALSRMAAENHIAIIAGVAERADSGQAENAALCYDNAGALRARYTKMHPFTFASEHEHYAAGTVPVVFDLAGAASSVFICYDLRFPEAFRTVADRVGFVYVLANWPASRQDHFLSLLKARAIENQCFVAGVNRTGTDGNGIAYSGGSVVYGPLGDTVAMAESAETVLMAECDPALVAGIRNKHPFLKDRKTP